MRIIEQQVTKKSILDCIGNTPMVKLSRIAANYPATLLAKLEFMNPSGSVKDRIALGMIEAAEKEGKLKPGQPIMAAVRADKPQSSSSCAILEPTGGNTGVALALASAAKGYKLILVMPETVSLERRNLLKAYGAKIIVTPAREGMKGAVSKTKELAKQNGQNIFIPSQFDNPINPETHARTTAKEVWQDTDGKVDIIVCGVGTGGTLTGLASALKKQKPSIKAIAVEPTESAVISGKSPGSHGIPGLGAGFLPNNLRLDLVDEVISVSTKQAEETSRKLAQTEGILAGISSGAALWAALQVGRQPENYSKTIVVILPDRGDRYLNHPAFSELAED
jgi:cysteine synthase A